jgi:hypothetical protein
MRSNWDAIVKCWSQMAVERQNKAAASA